ncbi:unnamed protein product [Trifolium pratense]|uniref:Uncharacterized protein n=1 Tax=Trifolium pratense TaxID=57577 RepID=A0ACB0KFV2_TRIPR|nr:unnamed protein product [Trifolium pratense]
MVEIVKFVYLMIFFISLFHAVVGDYGLEEMDFLSKKIKDEMDLICRYKSECSKFKCPPPTLPACIGGGCRCHFVMKPIV